MCGGARGDGDLAAGNFVLPTLFADVSNDMSIAREEIFGPVLSVIPFSGEGEAVRWPTTPSTAWPPPCGPPT